MEKQACDIVYETDVDMHQEMEEEHEYEVIADMVSNTHLKSGDRAIKTANSPQPAQCGLCLHSPQEEPKEHTIHLCQPRWHHQNQHPTPATSGSEGVYMPLSVTRSHQQEEDHYMSSHSNTTGHAGYILGL